jgi:hypothetical protein
VATLEGENLCLTPFGLYLASGVSGRGPAGLGKSKLLLPWHCETETDGQLMVRHHHDFKLERTGIRHSNGGSVARIRVKTLCAGQVQETSGGLVTIVCHVSRLQLTRRSVPSRRCWQGARNFHGPPPAPSWRRYFGDLKPRDFDEKRPRAGGNARSSHKGIARKIMRTVQLGNAAIQN